MLERIQARTFKGETHSFVTTFKGATRMYRRSGLVISREQGLRYDAGFAVPVQMS